MKTDLSKYLIWKGQALGNFCLTLSSSSAYVIWLAKWITLVSSP